jgi:hypothetical protein
LQLQLAATCQLSEFECARAASIHDCQSLCKFHRSPTEVRQIFLLLEMMLLTRLCSQSCFKKSVGAPTLSFPCEAAHQLPSSSQWHISKIASLHLFWLLTMDTLGRRRPWRMMWGSLMRCQPQHSSHASFKGFADTGRAWKQQLTMSSSCPVDLRAKQFLFLQRLVLIIVMIVVMAKQ